MPIRNKIKKAAKKGANVGPAWERVDLARPGNKERGHRNKR